MAFKCGLIRLQFETYTLARRPRMKMSPKGFASRPLIG